MIVADVTRNRFAHPPHADGVRGPRPWGMALAVILILLGLIGVVSNAIERPALLVQFEGWPQPKMPSSVLLTLVSCAFLSLLRSKRQLALIFSGVASVIGLGGIFGALGAFPVPLGGISLSTAVLFSTLAFAMLFATASASARDEERALGIAGFVVIALVGTMFGATAMGVLDPVVDRNVAGSSLQTLLTALALGVYWLAMLWSSGRVTLESADWLPAGVGFASILAVLVLWRALTVREIVQLNALTEQASNAQSRAMVSSAGTLARSLTRASERRADGASASQQTRDLESLKRDLHGLENAFYVSRIDDGLTDSTVATVPALNLLWKSRVRAINALHDSTAYWPLDSLAKQFAVIAPSCAAGNCDGAIVGIVRSNVLFGPIVSDTSLGFHHALDSAARSVDSISNATAASEANPLSVPVRIGDVVLQLRTWPTRTTISRVRSKLPAIMLTMGVLLSILLVVITSLGLSARRLARSREKARLASVLERSTDGIWEWDLATDAADHSAGIWRNLGYTVAAPTANREAWQALIHPDDLDGFNRALQRHLSGDLETFEHEYRVRSANGDWHTMVDRARVVERTPADQPVRLLGVRADVTEARNAHAARLLNERRFRAIFDSGFQYQLLLDLEGQVLEVNRVALEACHAAVTDVVGKSVWNTLWWESTPEARASLQQAIATARAGSAARYEAEVHCDGEPMSTLEVALKPFLDRAGQTNQLLLEARDITVRRRAEAALQEVDTLTTMGRVAARVAHEINNPLAGIQNSFLLIKGAIPTTHPHYSYVGAIEREIDRIAAVTRQLYETYRPEQDMGGGTSVRSLVADAVSFLAQVNRGTHVRIETDFSNVPSVIQLPSAMLRQIVYNLAQNAIEASPSGQTVSIYATVEGAHFRLSVRDRGAGVPAELRDRIFDPFFSTKDRGVRTGGMGLGLALVRRTVTAAGGSIAVVDAPDGGSILITLPVPSGAPGENA